MYNDANRFESIERERFLYYSTKYDSNSSSGEKNMSERDALYSKMYTKTWRIVHESGDSFRWVIIVALGGRGVGIRGYV